MKQGREGEKEGSEVGGGGGGQKGDGRVQTQGLYKSTKWYG